MYTPTMIKNKSQQLFQVFLEKTLETLYHNDLSPSIIDIRNEIAIIEFSPGKKITIQLKTTNRTIHHIDKIRTVYREESYIIDFHKTLNEARITSTFNNIDRALSFVHRLSHH